MQWNIERKWTQDEMSENEESFRNSRCGVRKCHGLARDLKEVGTEIGKKRNSEDVEHFRNSRMT